MSKTQSWIVDVDAQNFETEVVMRSRDVPVVVDFWATWCEPCKDLGPRLEAAAKEGAGRFVLAKVDIDKNPELAQVLRVQGVPAVLGLTDGRIADGFQGAVPQAEIDAFLDRLAPRRASALDAAREMLAAGDLAGAEASLQTILVDEPDLVEARLLMVRTLLDALRPAEARVAFDTLSAEAREQPEAKTLETALDLAENAGDLSELEARVQSDPADLGARIEFGKALVARKAHERGLETLLDALREDPTFDGGAAKRAMLEVFEILGLEDPVANDYRFKLSLEVFG